MAQGRDNKGRHTMGSVRAGKLAPIQQSANPSRGMGKGTRSPSRARTGITPMRKGK